MLLNWGGGGWGVLTSSNSLELLALQSGITTSWFEGLYEVLEIKLGSAMCEAHVLSIVLSLWPQDDVFFGDGGVGDGAHALS